MEISEKFSKINELWKEKKFEEIVNICNEIIATKDCEEHEKAYAMLRKAHALELSSNIEEAKKMYKLIIGSFTLPQSFRFEATQKLKELDGLNKKPSNNEKLICDYTPKFEYFVSDDGNDNNQGTKDCPFATINKAMEVIRTNENIKGCVCVNFSEGRYDINETINFNYEDSGDRGCPIIFKGNGNVVFYGGKEIKDFSLVTDEKILSRIPESSRGKIYETDLKAQGINDYGKMSIHGYFYRDPEATFELFVNNESQKLVRYPKEGFLDVDNLIQGGHIKTGEASIFEYKDPKFEQWDTKDLWLFGYFRYLWADRTIKVDVVDKEKKQLIMKEAYHWTDETNGRDKDGMANEQGIVYYAFNILEEISEPGEYYLDRETGKLYIYPNCDINNAKVEINYINDTMFKFQNAEYIRFENIHFDMGRRKCIEIYDSKNIEFIKCKISRFASDAIVTKNIYNIIVYGCEICDMGRGGVLLNGGDRATLTPSNSLVENCKIHDCGRIDRTYTPAILLEGCGMKASHNEMYNGPSSAMRVEGNELIVEYNDFHDLLQESDDQGIIDVFQDFTYRGQFYRYNYFHDNGLKGAKHVAGQGALRFDDAISGMVVYGNVIERSATGGFGGVQINSGRDNIIDNNLFIECDSAFTGGFHPYNPVWNELRENRLEFEPIMNDLYFERYPELKNVYDMEGVNYYWRNILIDCKNFFPDGFMVNAGDGSYGNFKIEKDKLRVCFDNHMIENNLLNEKYELSEKISEILTFGKIPFEEIGLYKSKYSRN